MGRSYEDKIRAITTLATKGYVVPTQMARILGVALPTVIGMIERGELRAIKVGKQYRIWEEEVTRFLIEGNHINEETVQRLEKEIVHHG